MTRLKSRRTTLQRKPERGAHDFQTIAAILDEALVCHIGFVVDGQPFVVPTGFGRDGRTLYIHGSSASRMLRSLAGGIEVCVTVTLFDGLVFARSAFHNSVNYRSVMILGVAEEAEGDAKLHGLRTITEHMMPGRWEHVRHPTAQELKASTVLRIDIAEASAKVRTGGPIEEPDDLSLGVWAGVLPFALVPQPPLPDEQLAAGIAVPEYVSGYTRGPR